MRISRFLWRAVVFPIAFSHEGLHYLAARLVGVRARIGFDYILFSVPDQAWKTLFIALTPAAVGAFCLGAALLGWWSFAHTLREHLFWSCLAWMAFWYVAMCYVDFINVIHFIRFGIWPMKAEQGD